jgi:hypothetical protein
MSSPKIPKGYQGTYAKNANGGDTLIMVSRHIDTTKSKKRSNDMADKKQAKGNDTFKPTFVKYDTMTEREKGIFKQGATTANNSIKEKLGLKKPR